MSNQYDLIVVGAGPSGLMAARTAAQNGLSVGLFERNNNLAPVKRGCAMIIMTLNEPYFGEEKISLDRQKGELSFQTNGFSIKYDGPSRDLYSWHLLSPNGKVLKFGDAMDGMKTGEHARTSAVHDKGLLLSSLLEECEDLGVDIFLGANVSDLEKKQGKIHVISDKETLSAPFVIAADGANSRVAQVLKLNSERTCYGVMKISGAEITGVKDFDTHTFYSFLAGKENPSYSVLVPMPTSEEGRFQVFTVVFDPDKDASNELDSLLNSSCYAPSFQGCTIVRKTAAVEKMYSSMPVPYHDQVLVIGDAAWCQEIEITPALMCGWNAGNSITTALNENRISREGVESYLDWWKKSCLGTHDYRDYLKNYALSFLMTNEQLDYLLDQVCDVLPAMFNPYVAFDILGQNLSGSMEKIACERPDIVQKMQEFAKTPLEKLMQKPSQAAAKLT